MATAQRTLLLAPPSIASHEETLHNVYTTFDRAASDLTMLDRLSSGLVALPPATYDLVVVLTDAAGARRDEAVRILTRRVYDAVAGSMKPGAVLRAQAGPSLPEAEAILAGLVSRGDGTFEKAAEEAPVLLRLGGGKKKNGVVNGKANGGAPIPKIQPVISLLPDDDLDGFEDDELIDENTLLTEEDIKQTLQPPAECIPKIGKRRRACKDCTCGLAAKIEAEDAARRAKGDADLNVLRLGADDLDDLALDFTVKGKVGSCGSCSLGDAFRCADCPYIGLPAFKPGEEVTILNNVAQL
ncbi:cytokine-induced anti-apoptosis inhibitor 1, Fe-S biogenesis-domain-containing protein [Hypoxylon argillaceum]|nr:cytokine-induced anti-apoptosis inhibitor 1, Fe-S biogenesis-domain-containing protein [Hypoxylon argillaceum]KAI1152950.1 cytokine-induced anti-apoptosis inhibitor 1, Fe-S biogenesis-domain-containing protein [Nemania diffusa]